MQRKSVLFPDPLGPMRQTTSPAATSSDTGRVRTVAWQKGRTTHVWLANLREIPVEVNLRSLPKGKATLWMLDETSFDAAIRDPDFDNSAPLAGKTVTLAPFAVARIDVKA